MHDLLHSYLDDELDESRRSAYEDHLTACANCAQELANQRELRTALRDNSLRHRPPASLATRIQSSLARTEIPVAAAGRRLAWLAAAALLIGVGLAGVGVALVLRAPTDMDRLAQEATANHARALLAEHLFDIASTDRHTVKPWFQGKLDFAPPVVDLQEQGFPLVGGRLDVIDGRTAAALVYKRRQHVINLFVWPAQADREVALRTTSQRGFHITYWAAGSLNFWAVSDLDDKELQEFARLVQVVTGVR